jgi:putative hydrolase of the HAD superfamily
MNRPRLTYRAAVFDLFGTLVEGASRQEYEDLIRRVADVTGSGREAYQHYWMSDEARRKRATGILSSPEAIVEDACQALGIAPSSESVSSGARLRVEAMQAWLRPRPDAAQALTAMANAGIKLGLMSDCTAEVPRLWPGLPFASLFDAALFSCLEGVRKPDPVFYQRACARLGVAAGDCLYVGDGASRELTGARSQGMDAVLIAVPGKTDEVLSREDAHTWTGPRVASLTGLLSMVGLQGA